MAKIIGIIEKDSITGVKYGTIEVPENKTKIERARRAFEATQKVKAQKTRKNNTKQK